MAIDIEEIKRKLYEKLPEILPGIIKELIVHIVLMLYHISMPPWVILMKIKKKRNAHKASAGMEIETEDGYIGRRKRRRRRRR